MKPNRKAPKGPRKPKAANIDKDRKLRPPGAYEPAWSKKAKLGDLQDIRPLPDGERVAKVAYSPIAFSGGNAAFLPETVAKGRLLDEASLPSGARLPPQVVIPSAPLDNPEATRDAILEYVANGGSLKDFTKLPGSPTMAQLSKLFAESEAAQAALEMAKTIRADILFDEIITTADSDIEINRAKLMVEARKYAVERLNQKKYSLKHEITGELGLTINVKRFGEETQWRKDPS
jgi:hypothetical protein